MTYLEVDALVLLAQTRKDWATLSAAGGAIVVLGDRVDGADASVGLEQEVAVGGQIGQGNVSEFGEHLLALGRCLEVTINPHTSIIRTVSSLIM